MLTIHHLSTSHSHVVLWLAEELGLAYDLVLHEREPSGRAPESLAAIHPARRSPTIEDHGVAMVESTGIILYLVETYGEGRLRPPPGTPEAMQYYQWLTYIEGSAKAQLVQLLRVQRMAPEDPSIPMLEAAAAVHMRLIEDALGGRGAIVQGVFTAADLQLAFYEEILDWRGQIGDWPHMAAHLDSMRARPAFQRALAKGGPVMMAQRFGAR